MIPVSTLANRLCDRSMDEYTSLTLTYDPARIGMDK